MDEQKKGLFSTKLIWNPRNLPKGVISMIQSKNRYSMVNQYQVCDYLIQSTKGKLLYNCSPLTMNTKNKNKTKTKTNIYIYMCVCNYVRKNTYQR